MLDRDPESKTYGQRLQGTVFDLVARARHPMRDGFPTSSGLSGGGSTSDVGDPVGTLVEAKVEAEEQGRDSDDEVRRARVDVLRGLRSARGDLAMAVSALVNSQPPTSGSIGPPGCTSCARLGRHEAVHRSGRCTWCYPFWTTYKIDPPLDLLELHHQGRRISERMVRDALRSRRKVRAGR